MRIFVSEYVCGGGAPPELLESSLRAEGAAMLGAAVDDFSQIAGCEVATTWDRRLGRPPCGACHVRCVDSLDQERAWFLKLAGECDAALLIAPEIDGVLSERARWMESVGARLLGPSRVAIDLCTDKLALCAHLQAGEIPTIPTDRIEASEPEDPGHFPVVVKRRDGAGSLGMRRLDNSASFVDWKAALPFDAEYVVQPFLPGRSLSVAAQAVPSGGVDVLPVGEQEISDDGRFRYRGGRIPARDVPRNEIAEMVRRAWETIPGLSGLVGFDILLPDSTGQPVVVEINPRLTTSYLGYRALSEENLLARLLPGSDTDQMVAWSHRAVRFSATGEILRVG